MARRHALISVTAKPAPFARDGAAWIGTADVRSSDGAVYYFVVFSEETFPTPEEAKNYARRMAAEAFESAHEQFDSLVES